MKCDARATGSDDTFFHRLNLKFGEMKFIPDANLMSFHPGVKSFFCLGSFPDEIAVSLKKSLQALLNPHFRISFFQKFLTAKAQSWSGNGVLQQIFFLSERGHG